MIAFALMLSSTFAAAGGHPAARVPYDPAQDPYYFGPNDDDPLAPFETTVLFCGGGSVDGPGIGGHAFWCRDPEGHRYKGFGVGVGFSPWGMTGFGFTLIARHFKNSDLAGVYLGPRVALAVGLGVGTGVFYRQHERPSKSGARERLYWLGLEVGADIDFSGLHINLAHAD